MGISKVFVTENSKETEKLLVGTKYGTYEIKKNKAHLITKKGAFTIYNSRKYKNIVFLGSWGSTSSIFWDSKKNKWVDNGEIENVNCNYVRTINMDKEDNLWFSDNLNLYKMKLDFNDNRLSNLKSNATLRTEKYDTLRGISNYRGTNIYTYENNDTFFLFFATKNGLKTYNKKTNSFVPAEFFCSEADYPNKGFLHIDQDNKGNLYVDGAVSLLLQQDNSFTLDSVLYRRFPEDISSVRHDSNYLWIGTAEKLLLRLNLKHKRNYEQEFPVYIRKVILNNDSVVFYGAFYDENKIVTIKQTKDQEPILDYEYNSVTFHFASPYFEKTKALKYSYKLEGVDKQWSKWSDKTEKEYTNLPEGEYILKIKAKNVFDTESKIATYEFVILPPWYRTWWAYISYFTSLVLFIYIIIQLFSRRLIKQKQKLKEIVKKRTTEISRQKDEIQTQAEELSFHKEHLEETVETRTKELIIAKEKAEESNRLKTEFLKNMSHEIRTPLNGILGFSDFLSNKGLTNEKRNKYVEIIQSSSMQLLRIIEDILEISKLGTKQIKPTMTTFCIDDVLLELISTFKIQATAKNIAIKIKNQPKKKKHEIISDKKIITKVLNNLLENAVKFTNEGSIEIGSEIIENNLEIYIKDTGIGITPAKHKQIFKRFSQEEKDTALEYGGLGLGLSIAKENAELLNGKITLKSEKGKGAIFYISIPYSKVSET